VVVVVVVIVAVFDPDTTLINFSNDSYKWNNTGTASHLTLVEWLDVCFSIVPMSVGMWGNTHTV